MNDNLSVDDLFDDGVDEPAQAVVTGEDGAVAEGEQQTEGEVSTDAADTDTPAPAPTAAADEGDEGDDPAPEGGEELLSGVDRFLSDYGVVGGNITYEGGESKNFNELDAEEQYNVLNSLSTDARPTVEEKYELDSTEIQLLNEIRKSELSVNDYMNKIVNENIDLSMSLRDFTNTDFENMPDEGIFLKWLAETNPEITQEDALATLDKQREDANVFKSQVNTIREQFISAQDKTVSETKGKEDAERFEMLENDRKEIVAAVEYVDNIGGAEVTDHMKNEVLHSLLEVNDQGDPLIMEEMFSDPEKLFKAAWLMRYGESYMANVDKYWRRKESEAYAKGKRDTIEGAPANSNGMSRNDVIPRPGSNNAKVPKGKPEDIDALWD